MNRFSSILLLTVSALSALSAQAIPDFDNYTDCFLVTLTARARIASGITTNTSSIKSTDEFTSTTTKSAEKTVTVSINQKDIFAAYGRPNNSRLWIYNNGTSLETWITDSQNRYPLEITSDVLMDFNTGSLVTEYQSSYTNIVFEEDGKIINKIKAKDKTWSQGSIMLNFTEPSGAAIDVTCTGLATGSSNDNRTIVEGNAKGHITTKLASTMIGGGQITLATDDLFNPLTAYECIIEACKLSVSGKSAYSY